MMVLIKTSLLFAAFAICFTKVCAENKVSRRQTVQIKESFNGLVDNLHDVYGNKLAREFLERTLDEALTLVQNEQSISRLSGVITSLSDTFTDQAITDRMMTGLRVVDHVFTNADAHRHFREVIELSHTLMTDPQTLKFAEHLLLHVKHAMKDEKTKKKVGTVVYRLLQPNAMQETLDGLNTAIKAFDTLVSSPTASQKMIDGLKKVANPRPIPQQKVNRNIKVSPKKTRKRIVPHAVNSVGAVGSTLGL